MIKTNLSNYYGEVCFDERNGEYVMVLDDWDDEQGIVISKEFFDAAVKEFKDKQK